jgi:hypothetical protein
VTAFGVAAGPGFLAHHVLQRCRNVTGYTLLDFSEPMLTLSHKTAITNTEMSGNRALGLAIPVIF